MLDKQSPAFKELAFNLTNEVGAHYRYINYYFFARTESINDIIITYIFVYLRM